MHINNKLTQSLFLRQAPRYVVLETFVYKCGYLGSITCH